MLTLDWIRGYMDRCSHVHAGSNAIVATAATDGLLRQIWQILRAEGYSCGIRRTGTRWTLRIGGLESLKKWQDEMGFEDVDKAAALKELVG